MLPGYHLSPPAVAAPPAQFAQPLQVPPPGLGFELTRAIPMHYNQQQPSIVYHPQVLPIPMPVALPVTPVLSYNTPPLMAKLPILAITSTSTCISICTSISINTSTSTSTSTQLTVSTPLRKLATTELT